MSQISTGLAYGLKNTSVPLRTFHDFSHANDMKNEDKETSSVQFSLLKSPTSMKTFNFSENKNSSLELSSGKSNANHVSFQRTYKVVYLGYAVLDRRYTLPMLPWVIAEIKRHGSQNVEEIYIEVTEFSLKAIKCENSELVFEHKLQTISKFAQSSHDPSCFTYMTREVVNGPCAYHVFQTNDESIVLELFTTVREMTKEMSSQQIRPSIVKSASGVSLDSFLCSCQQYEVLYLGRIKVSGKRAPPTFIDDAVEKFRLYEAEKARSQNISSCSRHRHGSGASISSLPPSLDTTERTHESEQQFNSSRENLSTSSRENLNSNDMLLSINIKENMSSGCDTNSCENINCKVMDVFNHVSCDNYTEPFLQSPLSPLCHSDHKFQKTIESSMTHSQSMESAMYHMAREKNSSSKHNLMPPSSLITHTQSLDAPGCADIVRDLRDSDPSVMLRDRARSCSGDIPRTKQTSLPAFRNRIGSGSSGDFRRPRAYTSPSSSGGRQRNRTMLFLIGAYEICLIGMDKKQLLLSKAFNDIAHCSQGVKHLDHFGFICRETTLSGADCYAGYIFRCQTEKVVDEMMQTLKQAFKKAHQNFQDLSSRSSQVPKIIVCDTCPMHWFHMLCTEIEGLPAEEMHITILRKLGTILGSEKEEIMVKYQSLDFSNVQEQNEVLMMLLREFSEQKQIKHNHIMNYNSKNDSVFVKEMSSKLDSFRQKAKNKLSSSFETILKLANRDEAKDSAETTHNSIQVTVTEEDESNIKDLDTRSYREGSYDGDLTSSGRSSPFLMRPRSSTFNTTEDLDRMSKRAYLKDETPRHRPIRNIFMKSHTSKIPSPSLENSPKVSWRQAIFHRVQTPVKDAKHGDGIERSDDSCSSEDDLKSHKKKTKEELRALWRKAILEQILLIRMEKENKMLQVSQDAASYKRMKLNYEEVTPCPECAVVKWGEILNDPQRYDKEIDKGYLTELVKIGVPRHKRGEIWQYLAEQNRNSWNNCSSEINFSVPYDELLKKLTPHQHPILIDLGRTFPNHPYYRQSLGSGQLSLFNLLKAYSLLDKEVGYCQGLSFVAGIILLHMSEEQAFSMLKYLMCDLGLRRQYKGDMLAFQVAMYQLTRLIHDNYKDLYDHLEKYDIGPTLYAAPWFLTLFASQFPVGFVARLFDLIFLSGMDVVFKVSLVLLGKYKSIILSCDSLESTMDVFKSVLPSTDITQLRNVFDQVFSMDISRELHAYEVEYHVILEEMMQSPSKNTAELEKLQAANKSLKAQNLELTEQLQVAYSRMHKLEASVASLRSTVHRLESHVTVLEDEKEALLHSVRIMKKRLDKLEVARIEDESESFEGYDEDHPPPFGVVYALAGSEKEEDEQFKELIRNFCKKKSLVGNEAHAFVTDVSENESGADDKSGKTEIGILAAYKDDPETDGKEVPVDKNEGRVISQPLLTCKEECEVESDADIPEDVFKK